MSIHEALATVSAAAEGLNRLELQWLRFSVADACRVVGVRGALLDASSHGAYITPLVCWQTPLERLLLRERMNARPPTIKGAIYATENFGTSFLTVLFLLALMGRRMPQAPCHEVIYLCTRTAASAELVRRLSVVITHM